MIDDLYFRSVSVLSHPFVTQYCSIAFFGREYLLFPFSDITLHAFQIGQLHCALHILSSEVLTTPICSVSGASSPLFVNKPICTVTLYLHYYTSSFITFTNSLPTIIADLCY